MGTLGQKGTDRRDQRDALDDDTSPFGCICHRKGRKPCNRLPCVTACEEAERLGTGPLE